MKGTDYLAMFGIALATTVVMTYAFTYFGVPGLSPQPPRNQNVSGQGTAAGT